ncbi:ABC transporter permease [Streptomyces sp. NPDC088124]|uniref:ABC transporter permease n=1 Tax=Streptomyces sp. NPDC088124 TaxID=3154654 RepID=UPI0034264EBB
MTGFVFLRAAGHRLLLAAALLAVVLTTCVLASLTAFSTSVGDTALRETLRGRDAASAVLVISADVPERERDAAQRAVVRGAQESFDGLPVTVRKLERSGPYALPGTRRASSAPAAGEKPDLTHFAALDRSRITLVAGELPGTGANAGTDVGTGTGADAGTGAGATIPVALPEEVARRLELAPGARIALTDRLTDDRLTVRITGVYRATDPTDPYWRLDALGGRGIREVDFTTYGPLLTDASVLAAGQVSRAATGWLAAADYRGITTDRLAALRTAATQVPERLREEPALGGAATVTTALPALLDRTERALLVSRSTLVIVALQLLLLAAYTLLLVARSLGAERAGETGLLRARGASRARLAALAATEALLLALPAALCAPLLAAPLTGLFARSSAPADGAASAGTGPGDLPPWPVWLVAAAVALGCAAVVVLPALAGNAGAPGTAEATGGGRGRAAALPAPVRAGADLALLVVAALAYWQLDRGTGTGTGALGSDREGRLGIDPLLVAAPALALLAGTVLTLRLLPPLARLAERRAARSRALPGALAAHRLARRSLLGAGPALLLVLAVATGMLALGQSASWDRSQRDQADFATGASVRVLDGRPADPGQAARYAALPGVRQAAAAHRTDTSLSGGLSATVIALDTAHAEERMLLRADLADEPAESLLSGVSGPAAAPERIAAVATDAFLRATGAGRGDGVDLTLAGRQVRVTIVKTVRELPTTGTTANAGTSQAQDPAQDPAQDTDANTTSGGAVLVDLRAVNTALAARTDRPLAPNEWWLSTAPGAAAQVAAALRDRSDGTEPARVLVRDETAAGLLGDPLGDGPRSALIAVALAAAALSAVGFAVGAAASLRERTAELAVLRALGAPRRGLARLVVTEQGVLIGIGLAVGAALGVLLTRALVPLTVLTSGAARPVPQVLVELPLPQVTLFLAGVAAVPLLITAVLAARRGAGLAAALRHQRDH